MPKIIVHLLWEGKFCSSFGSPPVVQVLIQQLGYIEIKAIPVKLEVSWIDTKVVIEFRKKTTEKQQRDRGFTIEKYWANFHIQSKG